MFENIQKTAKRISKGLNKVADDAIKYSTIDMADLNVEQMLYGLNADGEQIGEYRSTRYGAMKQRMNSLPPPMWVDLHKDGGFHDALSADYRGSDLLFDSTDSKTSDLTTKYGNNIFGLTQENQTAIQNDVIFPIITEWIGKQLQSI
jgi:hypothetical protein